MYHEKKNTNTVISALSFTLLAAFRRPWTACFYRIKSALHNLTYLSYRITAPSIEKKVHYTCYYWHVKIVDTKTFSASVSIVMNLPFDELNWVSRLFAYADTLSFTCTGPDSIVLHSVRRMAFHVNDASFNHTFQWISPAICRLVSELSLMCPYWLKKRCGKSTSESPLTSFGRAIESQSR